jgi:hypothetical protein
MPSEHFGATKEIKHRPRNRKPKGQKDNSDAVVEDQSSDKYSNTGTHRTSESNVVHGLGKVWRLKPLAGVGNGLLQLGGGVHPSVEQVQTSDVNERTLSVQQIGKRHLSSLRIHSTKKKKKQHETANGQTGARVPRRQALGDEPSFLRAMETGPASIMSVLY